MPYLPKLFQSWQKDLAHRQPTQEVACDKLLVEPCFNLKQGFNDMFAFEENRALLLGVTTICEILVEQYHWEFG
jgi:hypothetical protein